MTTSSFNRTCPDDHCFHFRAGDHRSLARPIADFDFLVGASLHRWLPFANALLPFALTAVAFGIKRARPAIAGFSAGTAAYLASVALLGDAFGPFGRVAMIAWCGVNALLCAWIARTNLAETT